MTELYLSLAIDPLDQAPSRFSLSVILGRKDGATIALALVDL
jgi:hypothetical protein